MNLRTIYLCIASIAGCVVTQTGNPPLDLPPSDLSLPNARWGETPFGDPDSVLLWEGQGQLRLVDMSSSRPSTEVRFESGQLDAKVPMYAIGDWIRVNHIVEGKRRLPLDVLRTDEGFTARENATPCLEIPLAFDRSQANSIHIQNLCEGSITLTSVIIRSMPERTIAHPAQIEAGKSMDVDLTMVPTNSDDLELLITSAGTSAVTLFIP